MKLKLTRERVAKNLCWNKLWFYESSIFLRHDLLIFRDRGREKERERNINRLPLTCPKEGANQQPGPVPSLGSEQVTVCFVGRCPTTKPHQSGLYLVLLKSQWWRKFWRHLIGTKKTKSQNCKETCYHQGISFIVYKCHKDHGDS